MKQKVIIKSNQFPEHIQYDKRNFPKDFNEFDQMYTAPLNGFKNNLDYWRSTSSEQHLQNIEYIKEHANYTIIDYTEIVDNWRMHTYEWVPSEKDYIGAMDNYEQFRDWQRIDYIQSLEKIRTWNCYSSFTQGNLHEHELFNDLVEEKCHMWYNIYEPGDSQDWHDHLSPEVIKSGIRFLTDPKGIEFENKDIQIQKQIEFDPSERHRVNPTDHFRISIAYNITK